jgi:hypothetical protein
MSKVVHRYSNDTWRQISWPRVKAIVFKPQFLFTFLD